MYDRFGRFVELETASLNLDRLSVCNGSINLSQRNKVKELVEAEERDTLDKYWDKQCDIKQLDVLGRAESGWFVV